MNPNVKSTISISDPSSAAKATLLATLAMALLGAAFSLTPHLACYMRNGTAEFFASNDDLLYTAVARAPYYGSWSLRDPYARPSDGLPTVFDWLTYVPAAKITRALHLRVTLVGMVWRVGGGAALGAAMFLLLRATVGTAVPSILCTVAIGAWVISDPALMSGRPFIDLFQYCKATLAGVAIASKADAIGEYRITSPLTTLPAVLLLAAVISAKDRSRSRVVLGACCVAYCCWTYFYYWTAVTCALGLLAVYQCGRLVLSRPSPQARRELIFVGSVLCLGLALGAPAILSKVHLGRVPAFHEPLQRMSRGQLIPAGNPLLYANLRNFWTAAEIAVGFVLVFLCGQPELLFPLILAVVGTALRNSAIVTHLEFENWHWSQIQIPFGLLILIAAVVRCGRLLPPTLRSRLAKTSCVLAACSVPAAAVVHGVDALRAPVAVQFSQVLDQTRPLRGEFETFSDEDVLAGPVEVTKVAVLIGRSGLLFMQPHTCHSSLASDSDVLQRDVLNGYLCGLSLEQVLKAGDGWPFYASAYRPPEVSDAKLREIRRDMYHALQADDARAAVSKFGVTRLLLPAGQTPSRGGQWTTTASTSGYALWHRVR